jgi:hypothetical protein
LEWASKAISQDRQVWQSYRHPSCDQVFLLLCCLVRFSLFAAAAAAAAAVVVVVVVLHYTTVLLFGLRHLTMISR